MAPDLVEFGGALRSWRGDVAVFGGGGVLERSVQHRRGRLMDHQDLVLVVLTQVLLGKVKAFNIGSLELRTRVT